MSLSSLGAGLIVDGGRTEVGVLSGGGAVLVLGSMVGNGTISQDPSTLEMEFEKVQSTGGDGDITAVYSGTGLEGGGESGDVILRVAEKGITHNLLAASAVTAPKIATVNGPADGNALIFTPSVSNGRKLTAQVGETSPRSTPVRASAVAARSETSPWIWPTVASPPPSWPAPQ